MAPITLPNAPQSGAFEVSDNAPPPRQVQPPRDPVPPPSSGAHSVEFDVPPPELGQPKELPGPEDAPELDARVMRERRRGRRPRPSAGEWLAVAVGAVVVAATLALASMALGYLATLKLDELSHRRLATGGALLATIIVPLAFTLPSREGPNVVASLALKLKSALLGAGLLARDHRGRGDRAGP